MPFPHPHSLPVTDLFGTKLETLNQCSQWWNSSYCDRNIPFSLAYILNCFLIYQVIIFFSLFRSLHN